MNARRRTLIAITAGLISLTGCNIVKTATFIDAVTPDAPAPAVVIADTVTPLPATSQCVPEVVMPGELPGTPTNGCLPGEVAAPPVTNEVPATPSTVFSCPLGEVEGLPNVCISEG